MTPLRISVRFAPEPDTAPQMRLRAVLPLGQMLVIGTLALTVGWAAPLHAQSLAATITSPANGAIGADLSQPIQWTTVANAQAYYLYVGTTPGASDVIDSGEIQQTSLVAGNFPAGQTLCARVHTKVAGVWRSTDTSFTAVSLTATLTNPTVGADGVTTRAPFSWNAIPNA